MPLRAGRGLMGRRVVSEAVGQLDDLGKLRPESSQQLVERRSPL
jgi:hypothetical protein